GQPVHRWPVIEEASSDEWEHNYRTVGQFMSTDLFTVSPDDLIDLAASVMDWRHIRHVPVEDQEGRLVGLITHRGLLRMMLNSTNTLTTVREIMVPDPVTVSPSTSSLEAMELMRNHRVGCLPVVEGDQLVGIITSYDFLDAAAKLFKQHLKGRNIHRLLRPFRAGPRLGCRLPGATRFALAPGFHIPRRWRSDPFVF